MDKGTRSLSYFEHGRLGSKRFVALPIRLTALFVANLAVGTHAVHAVRTPEERIIAGWDSKVWSGFHEHALPAETAA
tara:strand:- start:369 stop:599 length:231 start_codon:yes stop_codon:yes gene_type:complete